MMRLSDIRDWTGGELRGADQTITSVSTDTRALGEGSLFVALRGDRFDAWINEDRMRLTDNVQGHLPQQPQSQQSQSQQSEDQGS